VAAATILVEPEALRLEHRPGGRFLAYLGQGGSYDVSAARSDLYGPLPAMRGVTVDGDVAGLSFVLPPADDAVADGGFEAGDLSAWHAGGTAPPTLSAAAHTGSGAVRLGAAGEGAFLGQGLAPAEGQAPTLSFLVRLEQSGAAGRLQLELTSAGGLSPTVAYTVAVDSQAWTHVWYDLEGLVSGPLTVTFRVSDTAAILLDEVSLGSARTGLYAVYLPFSVRN
jgi:hypothetical protein